MNEKLLHYIWRTGVFSHDQLYTTSGDPLTIIKAGIYNTDSGPDFTDARIRIGKTLWAGNVEIHVYSSGWNEHGHQFDPAYDNTILHVVYEHDGPAPLVAGQEIPTLELKNRINRELPGLYDGLMQNSHRIPCEKLIAAVKPFTVHHWLERLSVERLEDKYLQLMNHLQASNQDWQQAFYLLLASHFGFKANNIPFEMLARSLDLKILGRHQDQLQETEALLFGQAGLLEDRYRDAYPRELKKSYDFMRHKYGLAPIDAGMWKFMRMRPANFPTLRLAQWAMLIHRSSHLASRVLELESPGEARALLNVTASAYWLDHYRFDEPAPPHSGHIGGQAVDLLMINVLVPFLFAYGKERKLPVLQERAISFLLDLAPENNRITRLYSSLGIGAENALQSQALIRLKKCYCEVKSCLSCSIGNEILKTI